MPKRFWLSSSNEAFDANGADARRTMRSFPPGFDPVSGFYPNIPLTSGSTVLSNPPAVDPLFLPSLFDEGDSNIDKGNSNNSDTLMNAPARPSVSAPTAPSSRALTFHSHAPSRPEGCARCGGEVAHASAGRAKSFAALFSRTFSRKGGSARPRHPVAGVGRERDGALLALR